MNDLGLGVYRHVIIKLNLPFPFPLISQTVSSNKRTTSVAPSLSQLWNLLSGNYYIINLLNINYKYNYLIINL